MTEFYELTALLCFLATVISSIIFAELMRRDGNGSYLEGLKHFFNGD